MNFKYFIGDVSIYKFWNPKSGMFGGMIAGILLGLSIELIIRILF